MQLPGFVAVCGALTGVAARPTYRSCTSLPTAGFSAMGGAWAFDANSSSVSAVGDEVTFTVPATQAGIFVQSSEGYPTTSDFTPLALTGSGCPSINPSVIASTNTGSFSGDYTATIEGLNLATCGAVDVVLGYSAGYSTGTILHKTLNLCTADTPATTTTTTPTTTTTTAAPATTTTTVDSFGYQFTDDNINAYCVGESVNGLSSLGVPCALLDMMICVLIVFVRVLVRACACVLNPARYVHDGVMKIMWNSGFSSTSDDKYSAIGFTQASSAMGPGFMYVGLSDSLTVVSTEVTAATSMEPDPATDTTVLDSGCEVQGSRLHCFVLRSLNGSGDSNQNPDFDSEEYFLLWATGAAPGGAFEYHAGTKGRSAATIDFKATAPPSPTLQGGNVGVFLSPTPTGILDVYMTFNGATGNDEWVGVGFGVAVGAMGPAEFYTGIAGANVTNRNLASGNGKPALRSGSATNVLDGSSCAYDGDALKCSFSRPLANEAGAADALALDSGEYFVRYAAGPVAGGDISFHSERGNSAAALSLFAVNTDQLDSGGSASAFYKAHGILMILTWLLLLPFGIFVARFKAAVGLGGNALWFQIHQPLQYIGVVLMVVAIVVIFVRAGPMTADYLNGTYSGGVHEVLGIISFALTLCQPFFAFFRNGVNEQDQDRREACHRVWHIAHAVCGYGALILALAAVGLGMAEYNLTPEWPSLFLAGYIIAVGSLVVFALVGLALAVRRAQKTVKHTVSSRDDAETGEQPKGRAPANADGPAAVAWTLFVLLAIGAVLCAVAVGTDTTRD